VHPPWLQNPAWRHGIVVTPTTGLTTTEGLGTATFTVVLTSQPTADVVIGLSPSDPTEGTVSSASLTFTSANWNVAQTVTVTGADDVLDDGDIAHSIVLAPANSADLIYNGIDPADVALTNTDNDAAGIIITPTSGLTTTEAGGTATFTIVLASQPTADVTIALSSSDTTEGTVSPGSIGFNGTELEHSADRHGDRRGRCPDDGHIYTIVTAAAAQHRSERRRATVSAGR
jgi:hypothetical protein